MDVTMKNLFDFVNEYDPQSVGVEISGQQGGFIQWIQMEMQNRDNYFNLAGEKGKPGIRPVVDKLARLNLVVPLFKAKKVFFAEEMKTSKELGIMMEQIALATKDGIKGKDDSLDTISMLQNMNPWRPSGVGIPIEGEEGPVRNEQVWGKDDLHTEPIEDGSFGSYVV